MASSAATVLFNDLSDQVSVTISDLSPRITFPGCNFVPFDPNEDCLIHLLPPAPGTHADPSQSTLVASFSEPGDPAKVSDTITVQAGEDLFFGVEDFSIHFFSAGPADFTPCSGVLNGCSGPETGGIQPVFTLNWLDDAGALVSTDTVSFESAVPEPSYAPWMLGIFGAIVLTQRFGAERRRAPRAVSQL